MTDRDPLTDAELERMLDGGPLPPALAALRSPAHPAELRGEDAALAAFRAARAPAPPARRKARVIGRALVVKVAVAGAVLAGGGLAVAAATGTLPTPSSTRPATTDQRAPGRPGGVVHERPTVVPHPPATTAPPVSPGGSPGGPTGGPPGVTPGNGNGWGRGHGTGKPAKPPKPPKPPGEPKDSKEPKPPKDVATG